MTRMQERLKSFSFYKCVDCDSANVAWVDLPVIYLRCRNCGGRLLTLALFEIRKLNKQEYEESAEDLIARERTAFIRNTTFEDAVVVVKKLSKLGV